MTPAVSQLACTIARAEDDDEEAIATLRRILVSMADAPDSLIVDVSRKILESSLDLMAERN